MLDDFRQQAGTTPFDIEEPSPEEVQQVVRHEFLGMTPVQRLTLSVLLLILVCLLGSLFLIVTGSVAF